jgi:hypothetical protein
VRIVPQLVLSSLVAVTGISAGAREDFHDCYRQPLNAPSCQARRQQMLVEMRPPIQNPDTPADARLQLFYSTTRFIPAIGQTRPESRGYELTLRKGATGWVVRSVRLTMIS